MADLFLPPLPPNTPAPSGSSSEPGIHLRSSTPKMKTFNPPMTSRELLVQTPMVNTSTSEEDNSRMSFSWSKEDDSILSPFDEWTEMCSIDALTSPDNFQINQPSTSFAGDTSNQVNEVPPQIEQNTPNVIVIEDEAEDPSGTNHVEATHPIYQRQTSNPEPQMRRNPSSFSNFSSPSPNVASPIMQSRKRKLNFQSPSETDVVVGGNTAGRPTNYQSMNHETHTTLRRNALSYTDFSSASSSAASSPMIPPSAPHMKHFNQPPPNDSPLTFSPSTPPSLRSPSFPRSSSVGSSLSSTDVDENIRASSVESSCSTLSGISRLGEDNLPSEQLLKDIVKRYLKLREDMRLVILNAKVAQKSYGTEKRFLCPPPCIYLLGSGWKTKQRRKLATSSPSPISPYSSSSSSSHSSRGVKGTDVCVFMGIGGTDAEMQQIHLDPLKQYGAGKTLHTADSDKRKYFDIHVKMFYGDGSEIGSFRSKRIKVISKPSKKKQTIKNADLCITSGSKVSLFNRFRAQTVSTRYLYVKNGGFCASATHWGAFSVYIVDENGEEGRKIDASDGFIHYGQTLKLVCSVTGIALPRLVIRKVDKKMAVIDTDEPISQLHKCALYMKDTERQYLCLTQEKIIAYSAKASTKHKQRDVLNDGSCWTIISTQKEEYCWTDSMLNLHNNNPVTPIPVPVSLQVNGAKKESMIEIIGEYFTPNLTVWFAHVEAVTMFRCQECLMAIVPDVTKVYPNWRSTKTPIKVPLLLIREDGVIYPTRMQFQYTLKSKKTKHPTIRDIIRSKKVKLH